MLVPVVLKYTTLFPAVSVWCISIFPLRSSDHFSSAFLSTVASPLGNYHKTVYPKRRAYVFAFRSNFNVTYSAMRTFERVIIQTVCRSLQLLDIKTATPAAFSSQLLDV